MDPDPLRDTDPVVTRESVGAVAGLIASLTVIFPEVLFPMRRVVVEMRSISASDISKVLAAASVEEPRLIAVLAVLGRIETLVLAISAAFSWSFWEVTEIVGAEICPDTTKVPDAPSASNLTESMGLVAFT